MAYYENFVKRDLGDPNIFRTEERPHYKVHNGPDTVVEKNKSIHSRDRKIAEILWEVETFCKITPPMPTHPVYDSIMQTLPHNYDAGKVLISRRPPQSPKKQSKHPPSPHKLPAHIQPNLQLAQNNYEPDYYEESSEHSESSAEVEEREHQIALLQLEAAHQAAMAHIRSTSEDISLQMKDNSEKRKRRLKGTAN